MGSATSSTGSRPRTAWAPGPRRRQDEESVRWPGAGEGVIRYPASGAIGGPTVSALEMPIGAALGDGPGLLEPTGDELPVRHDGVQ